MRLNAPNKSWSLRLAALVFSAIAGEAQADMPLGADGLGVFSSGPFQTFSGGHKPQIVHAPNGTSGCGQYCDYSRISKEVGDGPVNAINKLNNFIKGNPSQRWGLISQQLINKNESLGGCIRAGNPNIRHWVNYGKTIADIARGNQDRIIVRLGWEVGDGFPWDKGTHEEFRKCYNRVAQAIKSAAPGVKFEYNVHQDFLGISGKGDLLAARYPGSIVDFVGTDLYDTKSWSILQARLDKVRKFAKSNGARLAVSEWGLGSRSRYGFGDHPEFISNMANYFRRHANASDPNGAVGYSIYFNSNDSYLGQHPNSKRRYNDEY